MSLPERIGRYRILGFLASGGMAEILLAKLIGPGGFERAVVVKRVLPHLARQREFRDMFLDEARIVARIRHPNVVDVTELGQQGRELFMVMEYLAGESVGGLMRRLGSRATSPGASARVDPALALYVVAEAAAGLHAAHELVSDDGQPLGVVHRDVSPQNVFLTYDGLVKLLDFGIAKFGDRSVETRTGQVKGKFSYMSPEQCCGERLDRRSDVFSLGILLWELLTGARLFQRPNELLVWKAILEEEIPSASARRVELGGEPLPDELERVVARALARDKNDRYASADELRRDVLAVARALDPEQRGREQLAASMREIFPDRIQQKEEMLRRVRAGDTITSVPSAEVDADVLADGDATATEPNVGSLASRMTIASRVTIATDTDPRAGATRSARDAHATSSWRNALFVSMLLVAIAVGAGLGLGWDRGAAVGARARGVPAVARSASSALAAEARAAVPSTVRLHVETVPPGAEVIVAGEPRGATPLELELARGDAPVAVAIRLDGHREHVEEIVPDVDQRVRLTLDREAAGRARARARAAGTRGPAARDGERGTPGAGGGFFRFD